MDSWRKRAEHIFCSTHNRETTFLCTDCSYFICDQCVETIHSKHGLKSIPRTSNHQNYVELQKQRLEVFKEVLKFDMESQLKAIDAHAADLIDVINKIKDTTKEAIIAKNNSNFEALKELEDSIKKSSKKTNSLHEMFCLSNSFTNTTISVSQEEDTIVSEPVTLIQTYFQPSKINLLKLKRQFGKLCASEREISPQSPILDSWSNLNIVIPRLRHVTYNTGKSDKYKGMSSESDDDFEFC